MSSAMSADVDRSGRICAERDVMETFSRDFPDQSLRPGLAIAPARKLHWVCVDPPHQGRVFRRR